MQNGTTPFEVRLPNGSVVRRDLPQGSSDAQVREAFSADMRRLGYNPSRQQVQRPALKGMFFSRPASLAAPDASWRDNLAHFVSNQAGAFGLNERNAYQGAGKVLSLLDYAPFIGDAASYADSSDAFGSGKWGQGLAQSALATIGLVPGVGDALAASGKAVLGKALASGNAALASSIIPANTRLFSEDWSAPAFREWFTGSKLVDKSNNPIPLYHGTTGKFDRFDHSHGGSNTGSEYGGTDRAFYFAGNPTETHHYIDIAKARAEDNWLDPPDGQILRSYINTRSPLVLSSAKKAGISASKFRDVLNSDEAAMDLAWKNGNDAVIWPSGNRWNSGYTAAAFDPDQIWIANRDRY